MGKTKIIEVTWLDTYHVGGSGITKKEVKELRPVVCHSYGSLIEETDDYITIASCTLEQNMGELEYREATCIPKAVVQSVKELK